MFLSVFRFLQVFIGFVAIVGQRSDGFTYKKRKNTKNPQKAIEE